MSVSWPHLRVKSWYVGTVDWPLTTSFRSIRVDEHHLAVRKRGTNAQYIAVNSERRWRGKATHESFWYASERVVRIRAGGTIHEALKPLAYSVLGEDSESTLEHCPARAVSSSPPPRLQRRFRAEPAPDLRRFPYRCSPRRLRRRKARDILDALLDEKIFSLTCSARQRSGSRASKVISVRCPICSSGSSDEASRENLRTILNSVGQRLRKPTS